MPPPKTRTWVDGLDNLGENMVRLATSLKALEDNSPTRSGDLGFAEAIAKLAEVFGLAFRQTHPILVSAEERFAELVAHGKPQIWASDMREGEPQQAGAVLHEAILSSQEIISLLTRIAEAGRADAAMTRQVLQPSLPGFAESVSVVGWELKEMCHEYQAEVKLLGHAPAILGDLRAGSLALISDMADAAAKLRSVRRDWFRIDYRLAAATGAGAGNPQHSVPSNGL